MAGGQASWPGLGSELIEIAWTASAKANRFLIRQG
jgi:hypothetical protein